MQFIRAALTCALILTGPAALAKDSCVEVLASGAPSGATVKSEREREDRIRLLLREHFAASPLARTSTGRLALIPENGKASLSSEEFDEVTLHPLAQALAHRTELLELLNGQVSTKVNKAVLVVFHEGRAKKITFYNPRMIPAQPFSKSEYSNAVKAVPLYSAEGQELLNGAREAELSDETIVTYYQAQSYTTYCGIASSCMVLSSMRRKPFNQDVLMRFNSHVKPEAVVKAQMGDDPGFQLGQLVLLLNSRNERAFPVYAAVPQTEGVGYLRRDIVNSLSGSQQKVILNFHGLTLGTLTGGHFSPVAAFEPKREMVLILDTAAHKNEPFWIPLDDLYFAMTKIDPGSQNPRGWIRVIKRGGRQSRN